MEPARVIVNLFRLMLLGFILWRLSFTLRGKTWQISEITQKPSPDLPYVAFDVTALLLSFFAFDPVLSWVGFRELGAAWAHALLLGLFTMHETAHCCLLYRFLWVHAPIHFAESAALLLLVLYGLFDATTWRTALWSGGLTWALGVAWELGENVTTEYFDSEAQHGNEDLALDLASDALGILAGLWAAGALVG